MDDDDDFAEGLLVGLALGHPGGGRAPLWLGLLSLGLTVWLIFWVLLEG